MPGPSGAGVPGQPGQPQGAPPGPPNRAARPSLQPAIADVQGVQQALAKAGMYAFGAPHEWLKKATAEALAYFKCAETQVAGPTAPATQPLPAQNPVSGGTPPAANRLGL